MSKDSISVAVLHPDRDLAVVDKIPSDDESVRRLVKRVGRPGGLWACYEAGPTGYDLYRLLTKMGVRCDVVAPSLVPKGRGDRVKTDKRDARRLAGLHRAGELTAIAVPSPAQEAVRDLCRTRGAMVQDLTRARNRLTKFLLRHSLVHRDGSNWTFKFERWLSGLHFEDRALAATFSHYRSTVRLLDGSLASVEADLEGYFDKEPFADAVCRLGAYRGITHMGGLCLGAEVFDWRRFPGAHAPSCPSPGSPARRTRPGCRSTGARSPGPAMPTSEVSSARRPGPTSTAPRSEGPSRPAKAVPARPQWPGPGRPKSGCPLAGKLSPPART